VLADDLLEKARASRAQRAAATVFGDHDSILRQTAIAILAGSGLAEHDSPPEATLQVLAGRVRLHSAEHEWALAAGDLIAIPPERHSVDALDDAVLLLTVRRAS
jgi:quercetin dioxygenase-like cupin family protein